MKKGDTVSLTVQRDQSLVVFPSVRKKKESKEITLHVDAEEGETLIILSVFGCYLKGYPDIKILSENVFSVAQRKAIRNIVRMLYMRIMEADSKSMYTQTLNDETKAVEGWYRD